MDVIMMETKRLKQLAAVQVCSAVQHQAGLTLAMLQANVPPGTTPTVA
jgi:hypothetical protein